MIDPLLTQRDPHRGSGGRQRANPLHPIRQLLIK